MLTRCDTRCTVRSCPTVTSAAALSALGALAALPPCSSCATGAGARPVGAGKDGRPNILVVMTDDQAARRRREDAQRPASCSPAKGTTFANAVDSFPLCCPARATFITGQYAHNHGVFGNFYPYGWYGMKHRTNILPAWLHKAGYRTALIGKWLNGYGALDAHGEVPNGFDIWRGLLDVSAYDYFNFVMNVNGEAQDVGRRRRSRRSSSSSRNIEVTPDPDGARRACWRS